MQRRGIIRVVLAARNPWPTGSGPLEWHDRAPMPYYRFLGELNDARTDQASDNRVTVARTDESRPAV